MSRVCSVLNSQGTHISLNLYHEQRFTHHFLVVFAMQIRSLFYNKEFEMDIIRILLSILLPPLGVFLQVGIGLHFWINILLTILGYFPGVIHAVYIIAKKQGCGKLDNPLRWRLFYFFRRLTDRKASCMKLAFQLNSSHKLL